MWIEPESEPKGGLEKLQAAIESCFPYCDHQSTISEKGFNPHLSVGQWKKVKDLEKKMEEFQENFKSVEFEVKEFYLISRFGEQPFDFRYVVPLQPNDESPPHFVVNPATAPNKPVSQDTLFIGKVKKTPYFLIFVEIELIFHTRSLKR